MKCPKCGHYQDFNSLGACPRCGRSNWEVVGAAIGEMIVTCVHCERGTPEVPCDECGEPILRYWLVEDEPEPPLGSLVPFIIFGVVVIVFIVGLVFFLNWLFQ